MQLLTKIFFPPEHSFKVYYWNCFRGSIPLLSSPLTKEECRMEATQKCSLFLKIIIINLSFRFKHFFLWLKGGLLLEEVDLSEAHFSELSFIVVDNIFSELFIRVEIIFASSCNINKFIREDLSDIGAPIWPISVDFPLKEVFLGMELNCKEGKCFSLESWDKLLTGGWHCCWSYVPEWF